MLYFANSTAVLYASLALTGLTGGLLEAPVIQFLIELIHFPEKL